MSIVSKGMKLLRYEQLIVVSLNLLWASVCLLMCISSPLNLKDNYLSIMEAAIENCFEKYVLKIEAVCLNILTVGNCYFIYWLGD